MDRKRAAWTSLFVAGFLSATLCLGQAAWAAESRAQSSKSQDTFIDIGAHAFDWFRQALDTARALFAVSEHGGPTVEIQIDEDLAADGQVTGDQGDDPPAEGIPVDDPPITEIGPGMVPIG